MKWYILTETNIKCAVNWQRKQENDVYGIVQRLMRMCLFRWKIEAQLSPRILGLNGPLCHPGWTGRIWTGCTYSNSPQRRFLFIAFVHSNHPHGRLVYSSFSLMDYYNTVQVRVENMSCNNIRRQCPFSDNPNVFVNRRTLLFFPVWYSSAGLLYLKLQKDEIVARLWIVNICLCNLYLFANIANWQTRE